MTLIVVGIGGVTAGGKTTLGDNLVQKLPGNVISLHMDDYYHADYSEQLEYLEEYGKTFANWDSVKSVDFDRLVFDLETLSLMSPTIVILDGILIYEYPPLQKYFSLRYFMTLAKEQAFQRRLARRLKLENFFEPDTYFEHYAWPSYLECLKNLQTNGHSMVNVD